MESQSVEATIWVILRRESREKDDGEKQEEVRKAIESLTVKCFASALVFWPGEFHGLSMGSHRVGHD